MLKNQMKKLALVKQTLSHLQLGVVAGGSQLGCHTASCISGCNSKPTYGTNCG